MLPPINASIRNSIVLAHPLTPDFHPGCITDACIGATMADPREASMASEWQIERDGSLSRQLRGFEVVINMIEFHQSGNVSLLRYHRRHKHAHLLCTHTYSSV